MKRFFHKHLVELISLIAGLLTFVLADMLSLHYRLVVAAAVIWVVLCILLVASKSYRAATITVILGLVVALALLSLQLHNAFQEVIQLKSTITPAAIQLASAYATQTPLKAEIAKLRSTAVSLATEVAAAYATQTPIAETRTPTPTPTIEPIGQTFEDFSSSEAIGRGWTLKRSSQLVGNVDVRNERLLVDLRNIEDTYAAVTITPNITETSYWTLDKPRIARAFRDVQFTVTISDAQANQAVILVLARWLPEGARSAENAISVGFGLASFPSSTHKHKKETRVYSVILSAPSITEAQRRFLGNPLPIPSTHTLRMRLNGELIEYYLDGQLIASDWIVGQQIGLWTNWQLDLSGDMGHA